MDSRIESIVSGANEIVSQIYEKIGEIDSCKAVLKNLETAEVVLMMPEGIAELRPALDDEQMKDVKMFLEIMLNGRIKCAADFLEQVSGQQAAEKPPEEKPKEEPVVVAEEEWEPMMALEPEMTPADYAYAESFKEPEKPAVPKEIKRKVPVSKMTVAAVEQMFRDGYSVEDIAKHYNYKTTQTVYNFINKNKINVKVLTQGNSKKELTEANIPEIRALYTDGPMSLTDTAWELGTTKKILHDFCTKHHLHKIKR